MSIAGTALRGGAAAGVAQALKIAVQLLSMVILARLLAPSDFGLVAAVAPVTAFVGLMQGLGLYEAVIQRAAISAEELDRVFWTTVGMGVISGLGVLAVSPGVAWFFGEKRLLAVCCASAAPVVIWSLSTVPAVLLNRNLRFAALAATDAAAACFGFLLGVLAAVAGAGYWSLVIATIGSASAMTAGTWWVSGWRPGRLAWRLPTPDLMRFGANLTGFNFFSFFARTLDSILIGRSGGIEQLGYYDRATKLLLFPTQAVNAPVALVMIPLLSRMNADRVRLRSAYLSAVSLLTLATAPGMAAVVATSGDVVAVLLGPVWAPVAPILAWLAVAGLIQPLNGSTGWLLIAQARSGGMLRWSVFNSSTTIFAFCIGLPWGAVGVAAAYTITEYAIRLPALYWFMGRVGPVGVRDMLTVQGPLLAAAAIAIAATEFLLRRSLGLQGIALIAASVTMSYPVALCLAMVLPENRRRIRGCASLVLRQHRGHVFD